VIPSTLAREIADYATGYDGASALACEMAHHCLLDALGRALQALQVPACAKLVGPVVPGATMARGARVPGTSYELDPVQAAFSFATMVAWVDRHDGRFVAEWGHPGDTFGAILPVADYLSRRALAEARPPLSVRELCRRMIQACEIQCVLWATGTFGRAQVVRVAATAVVTSLLGGTRDHVAWAFESARPEHGDPIPPRSPGWRTELDPGLTASRAVRLALLALRTEMAVPVTPAAPPAPLHGTSPPGASAAFAQSPGCRGMEGLASRMAPRAEESAPASDPATPPPLPQQAFESSVLLHYPRAQVEKIRGCFADRSRLEALPVNELVSVLVRN
jgi:2-methylcitrate dehydratase